MTVSQNITQKSIAAHRSFEKHSQALKMYLAF